MHEGILHNTALWSDVSIGINILITYDFLHSPVSRALPRHFWGNDTSGVSLELDDTSEAWDMGDGATSVLSLKVIFITHQLEADLKQNIATL